MATTSPDNLRTPNPGDPYNLVADLATLANDTQVAINKKVSNLLTGTAAQRAAFLSTAVNGMLWQDTDGIKMIWRKDGAAWVPAVWRWAGTTAQMNGFTQAPNGFEWFDTTNGTGYARVGGAWAADSEVGSATLTSGTTMSSASYLVRDRVTGLVTLAATFSRSAWGASNSQLATLPVGFRPSATVAMIAATNGAAAPTPRYAEIGSNGEVVGYNAPPTGQAWNYHVYITFKAA